MECDPPSNASRGQEVADGKADKCRSKCGCQSGKDLLFHLLSLWLAEKGGCVEKLDGIELTGGRAHFGSGAALAGRCKCHNDHKDEEDDESCGVFLVSASGSHDGYSLGVRFLL